MPFAEQRTTLEAQLAQVEDLLRQAQSICRTLEERAGSLAGQTETFADDTALAQVGAAAKRGRQELGALLRAMAGARSHVSQ